MSKSSKTTSAMAKLLSNTKIVTHLNDDMSEVGISVVSEDKNKYQTKVPTKAQPSVETTTKINVIELDPSACKPWMFADRPLDEMGDIHSLAESIKTTGQQEPILVRPTQAVPGIQYEVIFGNRRWQACRLLGKKVYAIVRELNDQEASLCQKEENSERKDLSDYARANSYKKMVNNGVFESEKALAEYLQIKQSTFNDIMSFVRIPEDIIKNIPNIQKVSRGMAVKIASLAKASENINYLIQLAPKISEGKVSVKNINDKLQLLKRLETSGTKAELLKPEKKYKNIVLDSKGRKLFNIQQMENNTIVLKINTADLETVDLRKFEDKVKNILLEG